MSKTIEWIFGQFPSGIGYTTDDIEGGPPLMVLHAIDYQCQMTHISRVLSVSEVQHISNELYEWVRKHGNEETNS